MHLARIALPCCALLLCLALGSGCLQYSVKRSSSSGSTGWGGGEGAGSGGSSGSAGGAAVGDRGYPVADPRPAPARPGLVWDAALGLYRVDSAPYTFFDGTAYYKQDERGGWLASYERHGPWVSVTEDVIPPILRRR